MLISAIEHQSYCPRQCGLIHLESTFDENVFTLRGRRVHERADSGKASVERGIRTVRGMPLWSDTHGLVGKADVVEFPCDGPPVPIEYKHGKAKKHPHAEAQLCAQALCLEEMLGVVIPQGALYFVASKQRRTIEFDAPLRVRTLQVVEEVRNMLQTLLLPRAKYDRRCRSCSLLDACLPMVAEPLRHMLAPWDRGAREMEDPW